MDKMASKAGQDQVDDSWEEIDEEKLASRLSRLTNEDESAKPPPSTGDEPSGVSSRPGTSAAANSLPAMLEEELRPRMILQRPQMQILRRPQSKAHEEKAAVDQKPKTQIKSLDQRKQEYAEARLRILGSAHDEEEQQQKQVEQPKKPSPNINGHRIGSISNNNASSSRTPQQNSFRQVTSSTASPSAGNYQLQQQQQQNQNQHPYYSPHSSGGRNQPPPQPPPLAMTYQQQATPPHPGAYHFQHHQKQMSPYGIIPHHHQQQQHPAGFHHMGGHGYPGGSGGTNSGHSSNNNVLRLPAGPDGSHGFTIRR